MQLVGPFRDREAHHEVLIHSTLQNPILQQVPVHLDGHHLRRRADRRRELKRAVARAAALGIKRNSIVGSLITKVEHACSYMDVPDRKGRPVRRHMGRKRQQMSVGIH